MTRTVSTFIEEPSRFDFPSSLDLSIIILNYKTPDLTLTCLESLYTHTSGLDYEVILVDNASEDGVLEKVRERFPKTRTICNPENLGFSGGNNTGIRISKGRYVALLNSDAKLKENSFLNP